MDQRRQDNGFRTFIEHWGILFIVVTAFVVSQILTFFQGLSGLPWIWFCLAGFALMFAGGCLITIAKLPVFRSRRFFTFGAKSVPPTLIRHYRWGWRIFLFGVVLALCLLLSKP